LWQEATFHIVVIDDREIMNAPADSLEQPCRTDRTITAFKTVSLVIIVQRTLALVRRNTSSLRNLRGELQTFECIGCGNTIQRRRHQHPSSSGGPSV